MLSAAAKRNARSGEMTSVALRLAGMAPARPWGSTIHDSRQSIEHISGDYATDSGGLGSRQELGDYLVDGAAVGAIAQALHQDRYDFALVGRGTDARLVHHLPSFGDDLVAGKLGGQIRLEHV